MIYFPIVSYVMTTGCRDKIAMQQISWIFFVSSHSIQNLKNLKNIKAPPCFIPELQQTSPQGQEIETEGVRMYDMPPANHPTRQWTPIDNYNEAFDLAMEQRETDTLSKDYHIHNVVSFMARELSVGFYNNQVYCQGISQ